MTIRKDSIAISKRALWQYAVIAGLLLLITVLASACATLTGSGGDPPTANDDQAQATSGETITINVTANDLDGGAGPLTISNVANPTVNGGTATINGTSVSYTAPADQVGNDSFSYTIQNANGDSASATVTVIVSAAEEAGSGSGGDTGGSGGTDGGNTSGSSAPRNTGNTGNSAAVNARANSDVEVYDGPATNCQRVGTWRSGQSARLLAQVTAGDGSLWYKTVPPGGTTPAYVPAGANGSNFTATGNVNTLPRETGGGCGGSAKTGQIGTDRAAAPPVTPPPAGDNCGAYGDGGVVYGDDLDSCTYTDEYYDLCGNVEVVSGDLSPEYCQQAVCGFYGDGGCEDVYIETVGDAEACLDVWETICYDQCGNAEVYEWADVCPTDNSCGVVGDGGCDIPVETVSCADGGGESAIFEQTCYDNCGNAETYEFLELCDADCGVPGDGGCDPLIQTGFCDGGATESTYEETCYDLCGNPETFFYVDVCEVDCGWPGDNGCDQIQLMGCQGDETIYEQTCYDACNTAVSDTWTVDDGTCSGGAIAGGGGYEP